MIQEEWATHCHPKFKHIWPFTYIVTFERYLKTKDHYFGSYLISPGM